jgi:hypothetical protein
MICESINKEITERNSESHQSGVGILGFDVVDDRGQVIGL